MTESNAERLEAIAARTKEARYYCEEGHIPILPHILDREWLLAQNTELRDALAAAIPLMERGWTDPEAKVPEGGARWYPLSVREWLSRARAVLAKWAD